MNSYACYKCGEVPHNNGDCGCLEKNEIERLSRIIESLHTDKNELSCDIQRLHAENAKLKESNEALAPSYLQVDELSAQVGWLEATIEERDALLREAREWVGNEPGFTASIDKVEDLCKRIDEALGEKE